MASQPPFSFPSFQSGQTTPLPPLTFRIELRGTIFLAIRRRLVKAARDQIIKTERLENGAVPGLPKIRARQRAVLYHFRNCLLGFGDLNRGVRGGPLGDQPSQRRPTVSEYSKVVVTEDSERDHRKADSWQIRYDPDADGNIVYVADDKLWETLTAPDIDDESPYEMLSIAIVSPDFQLEDTEKWRSQITKLYQDIGDNLKGKELQFETKGNFSSHRRHNLSVHIGINGQTQISK